VRDASCPSGTAGGCMHTSMRASCHRLVEWRTRLCRLQAKDLVPVGACSRPFQRPRLTRGRGARVQSLILSGAGPPRHACLAPTPDSWPGTPTRPLDLSHASRQGPRLACRAPITTWHGYACECSPSPLRPRRPCHSVLQTCHGFWQTCCCHWFVFPPQLPCFASLTGSPC